MGKHGFLGIEGGGTKTTWVLADASDSILARGATGPGNTSLLSDEKVLALFRSIARQLDSPPAAVGAAMAGAMNAHDYARVRRLLARAFPKTRRFAAAEDTVSALYAAHPDGNGMIVIAGTGSNTYARSGTRELKAGGWGHLVGDPGSAFAIARDGLRAVYDHYDTTGRVIPLGTALLRRASCRDLDSFITWVMARVHDKTEIAALARLVFDAARAGCRASRAVVRAAPGPLAEKAACLQRRLRLRRPPIGLIGGLFEREPAYRRAFIREIRARFEPGRVFLITDPGALGAARFARATTA
jgi:N-acetylglucosamine kinase-like BadF-type ATPase